MQTYELTLVLPEKATSAKEKSMTEFIEKNVKTLKGEVKKAESWGKIDLAYAILKNNSGVFMHYLLELEPKTAPVLETKVRLEDGIIRHLMVKQDSKKVRKGKTASA